MLSRVGKERPEALFPAAPVTAGSDSGQVLTSCAPLREREADDLSRRPEEFVVIQSHPIVWRVPRYMPVRVLHRAGVA